MRIGSPELPRFLDSDSRELGYSTPTATPSVIPLKRILRPVNTISRPGCVAAQALDAAPRTRTSPVHLPDLCRWANRSGIKQRYLHAADGNPLRGQRASCTAVILTIRVTRPIVAMSIKAFVPIGLIVVCAALVFFVRPRYVEGRIGLGITALLTLLALQLTSGAPLPDVDYLMMIDTIYLLAYLFIILALARVVMTSWRGDAEAEASISRSDRIWVGVLLAAYVAANLAVAWQALRVA